MVFLIKLYLNQNKNDAYLESVKTENTKSLINAAFEIHGLVHLTYSVIYHIKFLFLCIFLNLKTPLKINLNSTEDAQVYILFNLFEKINVKSQINGSNVDLNNSIRDRMNKMVALINRAIKIDDESIDKAKILKMVLVIDISKAIY